MHWELFAGVDDEVVVVVDLRKKFQTLDDSNLRKIKNDSGLPNFFVIAIISVLAKLQKQNDRLFLMNLFFRHHPTSRLACYAVPGFESLSGKEQHHSYHLEGTDGKKKKITHRFRRINFRGRSMVFQTISRYPFLSYNTPNILV